jgi:hypothetical protein
MLSYPQGHPTITPLIGIPTYESIAEIKLKLNANATWVHSNLGDGAHGLLALTIDPAVYNTISPVPILPPVNPGANPILQDNSTAAFMAELTWQHAASLQIWKEYLSTNKTLKQQLLATIDDIYYRSLRNRITGYTNVTTLTILFEDVDTGITNIIKRFHDRLCSLVWYFVHFEPSSGRINTSECT